MDKDKKGRYCGISCFLWLKQKIKSFTGVINKKRRQKMLEEIVSLMQEEELAIAEHRAMLRAYEKIKAKLILKQPQDENVIDNLDSVSEEIDEIGG